MAINKERKYITIVDINIGDSYEEYTADEIIHRLVAQIKEEYPEDEPTISKWVIYSERGYDGASELCAKAYRMETDTEMGSRITQEEMNENKQRMAREEAQNMLEQQEYEQYKKLKEKYENK